LFNITFKINALSGVVGHGLFEGKNGGTAIIVAGDRGTRIAALDGKDGEVSIYIYKSV
jgi:ribose 5-phosphate isomerase